MLERLIARVRGLLVDPKDELARALGDPGSARQLLWPYVAVLAALAPVARFLSHGVLGVYLPGTTIFGMAVPGSFSRAPGPAALDLILDYAVGIVAFFLCARLLSALAPWFAGRR